MKLNWTLPTFVNTWIKIFRDNVPSCYPIKRTHKKLGRNEPCRCGSLMKYKDCHYQEDEQRGIR